MMKIDYPTFTVNLPISKTEIQLRVMTLREEKIILTAQESGNILDLMDAMLICINNCLISKINLHELPFFELQYIYLHLRSNSVGLISKLLIPDDYEKLFKHEVNVNVENVELIFNPEISNKILFTEDTGMLMKYPNFNDVRRINKEKDDKEKLTLYLTLCVKCIFDSENVYENFTSEEIEEYINNLPISYFNKLEEFINNIPKIQYTIEYDNSKGEHKKIVLNSLENFT